MREEDSKLLNYHKPLTITELNRIAELEKENAELKCECIRCVYADCPCVLSDYGKDRSGTCDHFKDVFDENIELKAKNKWYSEQVCNKECAEVWGNLTKAKELLAKWVELFKPKGGNIPPTPIQVDTEQFLRDREVK